MNHVAIMSFRKRNAVISASAASQAAAPKADSAPVPGVRPSPHDSRPTTSTGTPSLDNLLAGHAGLPLGTSLLIEEHGTTDFSGVLLRYYAAEGLLSVMERRLSEKQQRLGQLAVQTPTHHHLREATCAIPLRESFPHCA